MTHHFTSAAVSNVTGNSCCVSHVLQQRLLLSTWHSICIWDYCLFVLDRAGGQNSIICDRECRNTNICVMHWKLTLPLSIHALVWGQHMCCNIYCSKAHVAHWCVHAWACYRDMKLKTSRTHKHKPGSCQEINTTLTMIMCIGRRIFTGSCQT